MLVGSGPGSGGGGGGGGGGVGPPGAVVPSNDPKAGRLCDAGSSCVSRPMSREVMSVANPASVLVTSLPVPGDKPPFAPPEQFGPENAHTSNFPTLGRFW